MTTDNLQVLFDRLQREANAACQELGMRIGDKDNLILVAIGGRTHPCAVIAVGDHNGREEVATFLLNLCDDLLGKPGNKRRGKPRMRTRNRSDVGSPSDA